MDNWTSADTLGAPVSTGMLPELEEIWRLQRESRLPKARSVLSPHGTLTANVQPQAAPTKPKAPSMLPSSVEAYRKKAGELYQQGADLMDAVPDMSALQAFARQQGQSADTSMLNALAAQYAGEGFQPIQAQYLKRAAAAREPMKLSGGMLTPDGQFLKDPGASQAKRAEFLLQQAKAYEQMALSAQTAQERAAATAAQQEVVNQLRLMQLQISQQNAQTARMMAGGGVLGAGTATQIGSGPNNEPIMRSNNGQLFTYDQQGQAVPYQGQVNPKVSSAESTEDERKARGWFDQANNAIKNIKAVMARNPEAAYPTVAERAVGMIPGVGSDVAYAMSTADRQMFIQASESMAEALLRAATGAGVNKDEAEQKVRELVPRIGEKPESVRQKMNSYDVYMEALKARANRALPKSPGAPGGAAAGADPEDPFGIRKKGP